VIHENRERNLSGAGAHLDGARVSSARGRAAGRLGVSSLSPRRSRLPSSLTQEQLEMLADLYVRLTRLHRIADRHGELI
jgi:hypothetical protein